MVSARQGWNRTSAYQGIPTAVELVDNSFKEQVNRFGNTSISYTYTTCPLIIILFQFYFSTLGNFLNVLYKFCPLLNMPLKIVIQCK